MTGTNGKTTVTYLLESILREAGHEPGVIGTVNYRWGTKVLPASHTTPESFELQRLLAEIRNAGVTHVVMEVSSHALELRRVEDCEFDLGIFMNLTQDHLDFHGTMEDYYASKKRFFTDLLAGEKNGRRQGRIINIDDPWGRRLAEELGAKGLVTFGIDSIAFVQAKEVELSLGEIRAEIETPAGAFPLRAPLSGRFNLYNILAATAAAFHLGIPLSAIQRGIECAKPVPGRLEKISESGEPAVFVDYAHSEDALKRVLQNLARFRQGRIITVFGCGGDRDRGKRPLMGRAAAEESDLVIVTSDNPRTEEPLAIIGAIEGGIDANVMKKMSPEELRAAGAGKTYTVVADRREAIGLAVGLASPRRHRPHRRQGSRGLPDHRNEDPPLRRPDGGPRGPGQAARAAQGEKDLDPPILDGRRAEGHGGQPRPARPLRPLRRGLDGYADDCPRKSLRAAGGCALRRP